MQGLSETCVFAVNFLFIRGRGRCARLILQEGAGRKKSLSSREYGVGECLILFSSFILSFFSCFYSY